MRMKRFLMAVAFVLAVLTMGTSAWAYSYTDHVSVAPNGKGDLLILPLYVAADGWTSRIVIVNSSTTRSAVAKLVVRSYFFSQELKDFLVYLSPADMWIGYIRYDKKTGKTQVYSTDSSVLYDSGIAPEDIPEPFATETNPMIGDLADANCSNDYIGMGYVEIIEAWSDLVAFTTEQLADKQKRGKAISVAYNSAVWGGLDYTRNILSAAVDIDIEMSGVSMTASTAAVAMKDYNNLIPLSATTGSLLGIGSANNLREIDAALSKNNIVMPFVNNDEGVSLHTFTFPTKGSVYNKLADKSCVFVDNLGNGLTARSDYFPIGETLTYNPSVYDNDERRASNPFSPSKAYVLPQEFSFVTINTVIFKQGWINYLLPTARVNSSNNAIGQPIGYTGAPVIPLVLDFRAGLSIKNAAYDDGVVQGVINGVVVELPGYHYTSSYVAS